jgi:hypothetical protein
MTKHTCDGPVFGRLADAGECKRCDELRAGAAPRLQPWRERKAREERQHLEAIRAHDFAACAAARVCCTCFEW